MKLVNLAPIRELASMHRTLASPDLHVFILLRLPFDDYPFPETTQGIRWCVPIDHRFDNARRYIDRLCLRSWFQAFLSSSLDPTSSLMSGAYAIVQQLLETNQQTAVGIAYFLRALLKFATPGKMPIIVEHMNKEGATRVMMFSRQKLTTNFSNALQILKRDLGIMRGGYYSSEGVTIVGALFYNEDGTVQTTQVLISEESWSDLMAHVHKIYVRSS